MSDFDASTSPIDESITIASGRRRRRAATIAGLVLIAAIGVVVVLATRQPATERRSERPDLIEVTPHHGAAGDVAEAPRGAN